MTPKYHPVGTNAQLTITITITITININGRRWQSMRNALQMIPLKSGSPRPFSLLKNRKYTNTDFLCFSSYPKTILARFLCFAFTFFALAY
jgi:hypothetical protein